MGKFRDPTLCPGSMVFNCRGMSNSNSLPPSSFIETHRVSLKHRMCWLDTLCATPWSPTTTSANTSSILSHNYHFLFVVRTRNIYSICNFQVYNSVLIIITTLYTRSPEFIPRKTGSCTLWLISFQYLLNRWVLLSGSLGLRLRLDSAEKTLPCEHNNPHETLLSAVTSCACPSLGPFEFRDVNASCHNLFTKPHTRRLSV